MNNKEITKINISSTHVLKTLKLLLEDSYSMPELVKKLNSNEKEPIFNSNVVSKYINTCRFCGIKILKINNKYSVTGMPFGLNLSTRDLELLLKLQYIAKEKFSQKVFNNFRNFIEILSKYSNKQIIKLEKNTIELAYKIFEKAIGEQRKVILTFKSKTNLKCIPQRLIENKGKILFCVLDQNIEKTFSQEKIYCIEISDEKFNLDFSNKTTVLFKLKGGLAKRYSLRENENLVEKTEDYLVISNKGEVPDILFPRLLRYDVCCEIISPKEYRDEMKKFLDKILKKYEV